MAMDRHCCDHGRATVAVKVRVSDQVARNVTKALRQADQAVVVPVVPGGAGGGREERKSWTARAERPALECGISEDDWKLFEKGWVRYKRISMITDVQDIMVKVWECMLAGLRKVCEGDQVEEIATTERELLAAVNKLAVCAHNTLIAQVQFLSMGQEKDKAPISYAARLRGKSVLCDFKMKGMGCNAEVFYGKKVMAHQFVCGLVDSTIQEKVLAKVLDGQELSLKDLIGYMESQEIGKRSQALLSGAGGLNRMSDYQAAKGRGKGVHPGGGALPGGGGHEVVLVVAGESLLAE
jgi:hypothetical protein